jgi:Excalibur calcium-binding domain
VHRSTSPPPVRQTDPDVVPSYPNCHDLRLDHPEGVQVGHPAYRAAWDTDHDGWACDPDDLPLGLALHLG